ncbi:DUF6531 domain-containing protein [Kitasatospora sp. NPDC047058]|uniref:DUF6531 domain-containing protein n=1 Tax=Kitasatospora sp. NPDC047058 TaxID=3155620 RepID=UPI0033D5B184
MEEPGSGTAAHGGGAAPHAASPPAPWSLDQKRRQARDLKAEGPTGPPAAQVAQRIAGPGTEGFHSLTEEELRALSSVGARPVSARSARDTEGVAADWPSGHPYIAGVRTFVDNLQSGNTGLSWCATWDFNPDTPAALRASSRGNVSVTFYRASDNALIAGDQWMVYESTGWCSFSAPIQRGVAYYVKVRYGYADGSSDELTSIAAPPVPVVGVPDNVSLACPNSPSSTGIVLSLVKYCGDPVSTSTGAFGEAVTDAELPGPGQPFKLTRSYSSSSSVSGVLGRGWVFPYSASLNVGQAVVTFRAEDGSQVDYAVQGDGSLKATRPYVHSSLQRRGAGYVLTTPDRHQLVFDQAGRLTAMADPSGTGLTMSYTGSQLTGITDGAGRSVGFSYTGGLLTGVTLPGQRTVTYQYTGGLLTAVRDPRGQSTAYGYDANGRLTTVTDPLGKVVTANTYDGSGRVASQVDALGGTTTFGYDTANSTTYVTHPDGGIWTHVYAGGVISWQSDPYGKTTRYTYDGAFNRTAFTDPNGNTSAFTFDANGNVLTSTAPAPVSARQTWTYDGNNNVTSRKDALGRTTTYSYNALNQLTDSTDPAGGKTSYTYTPLGALATVTTPRGATTTYGYDGAGNRTSVTTPLGERTTFSYDAAARLTGKTDPRGNTAGADPAAYTTRYAYDAGGLLTSATDPLGNTTTYGYDAAGNLTSVKDPTGNVLAYGYDAAGNRTTVKEPAGTTTTSVYDPAGNLTSVTDPLGNRATYGYDKNNRLTSTVSPRGNASGATAATYTTTYGYDANGNRTTVTDPTGATTATAYDVINRPVTVTDPLGNSASTAYDGAGQVTTTTDPSGAKSTIGYDAAGRPTSLTDALGKTTATGYDADGNTVARTSPEGNRTTWTYDKDQRPTAVTDPRGNASGATAATYTTTYGYDAAGNPTTVKDSLGNTTGTTYDALNRPTRVTDPLGRTTATAYDANGRVTTVTDPTGAVTTNTWNTAGERTGRTDANGHVTGYTYDALHRVTSVTDPLGGKVGYGYDPDGHATTTTNARGLTATVGYDPRGLPTGTTYSDATPAVSRTYDKAGRPATVADATGTRALGYDPAGRLTSVSKPTGGTGFVYAYDPVGNLTSRQYADGRKLTYAYDGDRRRTRQTVDGASTLYAYNPAGQLTGTTLPATNGYTETRTYDPAGRLSAIAGTKAGTTLASWQLTRDAAGQPTSVTADRLGLGAGVQTYTYDQAGRLLSGCPVSPSTVGCASGTLTYTYDKVGNRLTQTDAYGTTTSTYDAADQLTKTSIGTATTTYAHDADGNLTSVKNPYRDQTVASGASLAPGTILTSNNARLIMQADGNLVLYQIDTGLAVWSTGTTGHPGARATLQADGNLVVTDTGGAVLWSTNTAGNTGAVAKVQDDGNFVLYDAANKALWSSKTYRDPLAIHATTYTYDAAGRPSTIVGKQTFTFTYDADGNRVTTKTNGTLSRTLTWDVNNPIPQIATETNGSGALIGDYTYNPLGLPQSQHDSAGATYHHHDWLGSVTDLTNATGAQQSRTSYDPYGRSGTATTATGAPATPFGFAGQYNDPVVPGKQYLRAREYDTANGRFNSRDPLATPANSPYTSAYAYAAGAPTVYTDPTGLSPEDDDPEDMTWYEAIGSGLVKGFKAPFVFGNDAYNALAGNDGGVGAFVDKYVPVRPAYAMYVAESKLREFGCNNVADIVRKNADELAQQVAVAGLGGLSRWITGPGKLEASVVTDQLSSLEREVALQRAKRTGTGPKMLMNTDVIQATAKKFGIDYSGIRVELRKATAGLGGFTKPDQTVVLARDAFLNEETLARTLFHEKIHVEDIRRGLPYPKSQEEAEPWEDRAYAQEEEWWQNVGRHVR